VPVVAMLGIYFARPTPAPDALDHLDSRDRPLFDTIARLHRMGVLIAVGADTRHGPNTLLFELQCLVRCGLSNDAVLLAATRQAARVCGLERDVGTLEPGKLADVLVVGGNPLADLAALGDVRLVLKEGRRIPGGRSGPAPRSWLRAAHAGGREADVGAPTSSTPLPPRSGDPGRAEARDNLPRERLDDRLDVRLVYRQRR
jgi:hypothetical protein